MKPVKVLVVEDNITMATLIKEILLREGWEVVTATDGPGAIETARRELPHAVILDVMIPKVDGFSVCRTLHEDPKTASIKVIMLSALNRKVDENAARSAGAVDYIVKPFDSVRLVQKIQQAVNA